MITPEYVKEQHQLHLDPEYGAGSHRYAPLLANLMKIEKCKTLLDYGAGKGTLALRMRQEFEIEVSEYDPGVPGKENLPEPTDMVSCIDVMEHIEPSCLDAVIKDLSRLTNKKLFVDVATKFDKHRWLSDGRNSHQIVNEGFWWRNKFEEHRLKVVSTWSTGMRAWIAMLQPC